MALWWGADSELCGEITNLAENLKKYKNACKTKEDLYDKNKIKFFYISLKNLSNNFSKKKLENEKELKILEKLKIDSKEDIDKIKNEEWILKGIDSASDALEMLDSLYEDDFLPKIRKDATDVYRFISGISSQVSRIKEKSNFASKIMENIDNGITHLSFALEEDLEKNENEIKESQRVKDIKKNLLEVIQEFQEEFCTLIAKITKTANRSNESLSFALSNFYEKTRKMKHIFIKTKSILDSEKKKRIEDERIVGFKEALNQFKLKLTIKRKLLVDCKNENALNAEKKVKHVAHHLIEKIDLLS